MLKDKLAKDAKRGQTKYSKHKTGQTSMLSNKRGSPRRTNIGFDRVSIVPLGWSMDNMHEHVGKHAKGMHRSKERQMGDTR